MRRRVPMIHPPVPRPGAAWLAAGLVLVACAAQAQVPLPGWSQTVKPGSTVDASSRARVAGNRATGSVLAVGGAASLGLGYVGGVDASAAAHVNAVGLDGIAARNSQIAVLHNQLTGLVNALGGTAAVNSVLLSGGADRQPVTNSELTVSGNRAGVVDVRGGEASIGLGTVAALQSEGRAVVNSLMAETTGLRGARMALTGNQAERVRGLGGAAAANGVWLTQAAMRNNRIQLSGNRTSDVSAMGGNASLGSGVLLDARQATMALANSLGVMRSTVDAASLTLADNTARMLVAQGGKLVANSVSVERGDGAGSRLSASVALRGNTATQVSTGAGSVSGPAHLISAGSDARAATNAVVLKDGVEVERNSPLTLVGNRANHVAAIGGTALVNALAGYRGARLSGSPVTLADNRAQDLSTGGGQGQIVGVGAARNGILVANGVYLEGEGAVRLEASPVDIRGNTAQGVHADGGRVNANAVAVNGAGDVQGTQVQIAGNRATGVRSQGTEGTVAGFALVNRGVGHANANALQVLGELRAGRISLAGNKAAEVAAEQGVAAANSVLVDKGASMEDTRVGLANNTAKRVQASGGRSATVNSVYNEGRVADSTVRITGNRGSAQAGAGDASVNSLRNRSGASLTASKLNIVGNRGSVEQAGTVNSVDNQGRIENSRITIAGNRGKAEGGGLVNSVANSGTLSGAQIHIAGNRGHALNGGTVNSVDNRGTLSGRVDILGNHGSAGGEGVVNSVVNHGTLSGKVVISGNLGKASGRGAVSNSVINHGSISGSVKITGNDASAGGGIVIGGAGLASPGRVINRTVTVGQVPAGPKL